MIAAPRVFSWFSFRGCIRRPMGHPPGPTTCTAVRGAPPLRKKVVSSQRTTKTWGHDVRVLLSTDEDAVTNRWWDWRCGCGRWARRCAGARRPTGRGKAARDEDVPNKRFDTARDAGDSTGQCRAPEHGCLGGIAMIEQSVLGLQEVDEMQVAVVGGKGAHLGGLSRIDGIRVPAGFCVTTDAFRRIMAE